MVSQGTGTQQKIVHIGGCWFTLAIPDNYFHSRDKIQIMRRPSDHWTFLFMYQQLILGNIRKINGNKSRSWYMVHILHPKDETQVNWSETMIEYNTLEIIKCAPIKKFEPFSFSPFEFQKLFHTPLRFSMQMHRNHELEFHVSFHPYS